MALIELRGVCRQYDSGGQPLVVLRDVDLDIAAGEFVAIMGPSGSGKSTLMNLLGLLDRPSSGSYRLDGREVSRLTPDQLAELRRNHFGFIFQRYHLLPDLDAKGNVEVPAVYAGADRSARRARARELLGRLGMADRTGHRPGQLSGGQQQRVSIARALMNGGRIVLADEPTGALDTHSGAEVMRTLEGLHAEGRTIIMVTHEPEVAQHAERIIEIRDGVIGSDRRIKPPGPGRGRELAVPEVRREGAWEALWDRSREALGMALVAMNAHRMRTFLTMLGIIIGIASVVSVVALGEGSRQAVLANISRIGTNTLDIMPGKDFGDMRSGAVRTLVAADADALATQPYVDSVTPMVQAGVTLRHGNVAASGQASGVGEQYFRVRGMELLAGRFFGRGAVDGLAQEAVIDSNTRNTLFKGGPAVGRVLLVGSVPCQVVGVVEAASGGWGGDSLSVYLPYTTLQARLLGSTTLRSITVRIADDAEPQAAAEAVTRLLTRRHGTRDFFIMSSDEIRQAITSTTETMTLLISAIAVISLIVGGIGVMNIMLVSVTERTREIGVRMAVGARQSDILQQFLIEAVLVCLAGGALGVLLSLAVGLAFSLAESAFSLVYSTTSIVLAFACSTLIGVVFGYIPARNAARLDPVMALARE